MNEVINFKKKFKSKVKIKKEKRNQGLQINIFSAINWLLKKENRFIFLEDDHKPSLSFFISVINYSQFMKKMKK